MGFFDNLKKAAQTVQSKLPEDMNSVDELKAKAQDLAEKHGDDVTKYGDMAKNKIPGQADDKLIDSLQQQVDKFKKK